MGEAGINQQLLIFDATSQQTDWYVVVAGSLKYAVWEFAHQRLTVCRALTRDDKVSVFQQFIEMHGIEQEFDA